MAQTLLRLEVERLEYEIGETVRGTLHVDEAVARCDGIDVYLECGGDHVTARQFGRTRLHHGPLKHPQSFEFSLPIQVDAPFTFSGHKVAASWNVVGHVDVPWAVDKKHHQPLTFKPKPVAATDAAIEAVVAAVPSPPPKKPRSLIATILLGLLFALLILGLSPLLPIALIIIARQRILNTRLSDFAIESPDRQFVLGEWVPITVRFRLKRAIDVAKLQLLYQGTEQWSTGSGKSRTTHHHHFHEQTRVELEDALIATAPPDSHHPRRGFVYRSSGRPEQPNKGPIFEWRTAVQLPVDGLPSVTSSVYYQLTATVKIRGWPDAKILAQIPALGARLDGERSRPDELPASETSPGLVFLSRGETPPEGVDVSTTSGSIWGWVMLPFLGVGGLLTGIALWADHLSGGPALTIASGALLAASLAVLFWKLYR